MMVALVVVLAAAIVVQLIFVYQALFGPETVYEIKEPLPIGIDEPSFAGFAASLTNARLTDGNQVEALSTADAFYEAELAAIAKATQTINLEAYIFFPDDIGRRFLNVLTERAHAGVKVRVILDYVGCIRTPKRFFNPLVKAGGRVAWYHEFNFKFLPHWNNRTHRELIVVDGETAFLGGAGIANLWWKSTRRRVKWRDTMFRVTGPAVTSLQAVFAENWLRASGEIFIGPEFVVSPTVISDVSATGVPAFAVSSTPAAGSVRSRLLYQLLIRSAQKQIYINTPYFIPDPSAIRALRAAIARGVQVSILVPGGHADHLLTRGSSRHLYGPLLVLGVEIFEYRPTMIHSKIFVVDSLWSVVGSTNFDYRSFGLNDEVNLAVCDPELAARLESDFCQDVEQSRRVTYGDWRRAYLSNAVGTVFGFLDRQQ